MKVKIITILSSILIALTIFFIANTQEKQICLSDKSQVVQEPQRNLEKNGVIPIKFTVKSTNGNTISEFTISDVAISFSIQPTGCNLYIRRAFNRPGYVTDISGHRDEIWKYNYNGKGEKFLTLALIENGKPARYFDPVFSVDWQKKYIVLEKTYTNEVDNQIVFKELKNLKKDVFNLSYSDIIKNNPDEIYGDIRFLKWSNDQRYFWGRLSDAAQTVAFFRIDTEKWIYSVLIPPPNTMGGNDLNPDFGYTTYNPASYWSGDADFTELEREKRKQQDLSSDLHIYNLFTKEDRLIESTKEDPIWFYKPEWISENELKYQLPSEQWKVYNLETLDNYIIKLRFKL